MIKVTTLGCGDAFSTKNYNSCFLITLTRKNKSVNVLLDAGWSLPFMLKNANELTPKDIRGVLISHFHSDHIGGLEYLALSRYDFVNNPIIAPQDDSIYLMGVALDRLWEESLKGGLSQVYGNANLNSFFYPVDLYLAGLFDYPTKKTYDLSELFYPLSLPADKSFTLSAIPEFHIIKTDIIHPSFGFIIKDMEEGTSVYFTSDSRFDPANGRQREAYKSADMIYQDCECIGINTALGQPKLEFKSGVHANYLELVTLPKEIKKKMVLTHYQDFVSKDRDFYGNRYDWFDQARKDGFRGFTKVGETLQFMSNK